MEHRAKSYARFTEGNSSYGFYSSQLSRSGDDGYGKASLFSNTESWLSKASQQANNLGQSVPGVCSKGIAR